MCFRAVLHRISILQYLAHVHRISIYVTHAHRISVYLASACMYTVFTKISILILITYTKLISAVDEQNAQTNNDFAQSIVTAATTAVSDAQVPNIVAEDNRYEHRKSLSGEFTKV